VTLCGTVASNSYLGAFNYISNGEPWLTIYRETYAGYTDTYNDLVLYPSYYVILWISPLPSDVIP